MKDADSPSFMENNVNYFIKDYIDKVGRKTFEYKINWTFERITSEEVKDIARPWYEETVEKIEKVR